MSRADASDPAIKQAIENLKSSPSLHSWLLLGYVPKSDTVLKVEQTGDDGLSECMEYFNDGKIFYALVSFPVNNMRKVVYISWCGEGVTGMKKGLFNNHANDVGFLFKGFHVQINARNEDDINEKDILTRLQKATGASYDSGQKVQGKASHVPTSVAQGKVQATQSNAKVAVANKNDYDKKSESDSFWTKQRQEEESAKQANVPQPARKAADYNQTDERNRFWAQQQQDQQQQQQQSSNARPTNVSAGNASSLKNRFEQAAQQASQPAPISRPPVSINRAPAPAPVKATPPPPVSAAKPPPSFARAPEPEPEPQQDEWQQEEQPQEQYYEQEQQHQEQYYEEQQQPQQDEWQQDDQQQEQYYEEQQQPQQDEWQQDDQQQQYGGEEQQYYEQEQPQQDEWQQEEQQQEQYYEGGAGGGEGTCRALYDYEGENPDDLTFREGDVITVLDKSDPGGWWQGQLPDGRIGFFPSNFVEE